MGPVHLSLTAERGELFAPGMLVRSSSLRNSCGYYLPKRGPKFYGVQAIQAVQTEKIVVG